MRRSGYIVGIDPDVSASGLAVLDCSRREFQKVGSYPFPEIVDALALLAADKAAGQEVTVVLEDSDLSTNWHTSPRDSKAVAAAKGRSVGMCHATARHLKEIAESYGLEVVGCRPLLKVWKGKDRKITHEEAAQFMKGLPAKSNQEGRDAALLAWAYADYPIRKKS